MRPVAQFALALEHDPTGAEQRPLRPLLGVQQLYEWDFHRVTENEYAFDAMAWARSGESFSRWLTTGFSPRTENGRCGGSSL
jgi:hypothetical protein